MDISRPNDVKGDVFPRAIRWSCPRSLGSADFSEFVATRCQLDYVDEAQVGGHFICIRCFTLSLLQNSLNALSILSGDLAALLGQCSIWFTCH